MTYEYFISLIIGLFVSLTGINLTFFDVKAPAESRLTAEQVIDLEVQAEQEFRAAGGQYE